ncbi:MAG: glycogen/starch/alpha-glucan phosphorylase [Fimbriimonadales bacterium]
MRMRQEMILGMGGLQTLRKLGLNPTVCHMSEGHAAFLPSSASASTWRTIEVRDFPTARQVLVKGNVFTTHTPVPAGFDVFQPEMLARYLGTTANKVGEPMPGFLRFGRFDAKNEAEHFNMAVLAMENSNHVNGVSELHAAVSRSMFQTRWKDYPEDEVPVDAITNGIHTLTWVSQRFADIFEQYLGSGWRDDPADPKNWEVSETFGRGSLESPPRRARRPRSLLS